MTRHVRKEEMTDTSHMHITGCLHCVFGKKCQEKNRYTHSLSIRMAWILNATGP